MAEIGDRFTVTEAVTFTDDKKRQVGRYSPEHSYRITAKNKEFIEGLIAHEKATLGGSSVPASGKMAVGASDGKVAGKVTVK